MSEYNTNGPDIKQIVKKWDTLLEGIEDRRVKQSTAIMLENQFNDLVNRGELIMEAGDVNSVMGLGTSSSRSSQYSTSGDFHKIALPMVRRTFPELIAHDLVGVQPMTAPIGLAFALRFRAGTTSGSYTAGQTELGYNNIDPTYSGSMATSAAERLGSYTPGGSSTTFEGTNVGLGIGTGEAIKEVQFTLEKKQVEAQSRKLRSRWSLEVAQDLKAMHGLNIEEEMMDILAYEITAEIDREIVNALRAAAATNSNSTTLSWTSSANFDGRWEAEKYRNLYNRIVRNAAKIAVSTRRGPGNFIVADPTVSAALEGTSAFTIAPVKGYIDTAKMGVAFIGTLDGRFKLYRDTFATNNEYLVGYRGSSSYDSGIIYLPYVQLQAAKATFEDSFAPTIGLMSRYAIMDSMWGANQFYIRNLITGMP